MRQAVADRFRLQMVACSHVAEAAGAFRAWR